MYIMFCYGFQTQLLYLYSTLVLVLHFTCTAHLCLLYKALMYILSLRNTIKSSSISNKAYDRVNWRFIQTILKRFGFDDKFINWITTCISSVSFEVLVHGGKSDQFRPSRGLRQGDPLLSYLFILGQEVLSRILDQELFSKNISGIKASIRGPALTHIMYANDIVLFSKATRLEASKKDSTSGRGKLSKEGSLVFFSPNTPKQMLEEASSTSYR